METASFISTEAMSAFVMRLLHRCVVDAAGICRLLACKAIDAA